MNVYLVIIIAALLGRYLLELVTDILNVRHVRTELPDEFRDVFDEDRYRKSQQYLRDTTRFGVVEDTVVTAVVLAFLLAGGFNALDGLVRRLTSWPIPAGLLFGGVLVVASKLLALPFTLYDTFVIEERYGFNRTTPRTFVLDLLKACLLLALIGGPVFAAILWFFQWAGSMAWLYCWAALSVFQVILVFLAPYVILPLFNKFVPMQDGELRRAVEGYAAGQDFKMRGVFTMDGSRRSAKSNAFFTGFGRSRRIVLFDTLVARHSVAELVAIVAHEMGHYKMKHVPRAIARSIVKTGLTFYLLSLLIGNEGLFAAFRMEHVSVYAGLIFFGFLYTPIGMALSLVENALSRRDEYSADAFAARTAGDAESMIRGLKRLSADNLSNLTPHPLAVFLHYGHPPVLARIEALRTADAAQGERP